MTELFAINATFAVKPIKKSALGFKFWAFICIFFGFVLLLNNEALAQAALPALTTQPGPNGQTNYSLPVQTLLFFTFLSFLPAMLLMMTGFTRIVIVLSLLRMAIGTQNSPPNQVIVGLALFLTFYVMSPVFNNLYENAYKPFNDGQITFQEMVVKAEEPVKAFMLKQTRQADLAMFISLSGAPRPNNSEEVSIAVLIPAFVTSELKTAFQIGFMIFLPFLVIDLVISSVLMSMGMMMLSPMIISLPFKLMLFVLVDGWTLIVGSLVRSFQG